MNALREVVEKHSFILQKLGCFHYVHNIDEKEKIRKDFLQWYFIYQNHFSFQRFTEGLSALDCFTALQQHPHIFRKFMGYTEEKLTAKALDSLFTPQMERSSASEYLQTSSFIGQGSSRVTDYSWANIVLHIISRKMCALRDV
ncbi:G2E3 ligase, partial [Polypterus senegalus]|nr:G2E3 ligase [Polypterus senegalus]